MKNSSVWSVLISGSASTSWEVFNRQRGASSAAVLDSVAAVAKYVVEQVFCDEIFFTTKSEAKQITEILNSGPGLPTLYREINGYEYKDATKEQRDKALISYGDLRNGIASLKAGGLMTQRGVSSAAVTDSVAAVAKYVVEQEFSDEIFFTGKGGANQATEILKSGPGLPALYREINGIAALPVAA